MQHFPEIQLTFQEARVLGCLLEKEIVTPDSYPLTHNSLLIACNQTSSRDPITHFTGEEVSEALRGPQSAGEIRQRTDRLHTFSSLDEVEETLTWFVEYPHGPLVRRIPVGEVRRVETFAHLLSPAAADSPSITGAPSAASDTPAENDWRAAIEARLASLESEIAELRSRQTRDSAI